MPRPCLGLHLCDSPLYSKPKVFTVMIAFLKKAVGPLSGFEFSAIPVLFNEEMCSTVAQMVEVQVDAENLTDEWIIERLMQEATTAPTDGARAACLKTLAQVKAMLIQVHRDEQDSKTDEQSALEIAGIDYMPPPSSPEDLKAEDRKGYDWLLGRVGA